MSRRGRYAAAVIAILFVACGSDPDDWPPGRPQIVDVNYVEQTSWDANGLTVELEFADTDGDLGEGRLDVLVNDEAESSIGLAEVFTRQVPPLPLDSVSGTFTVNLTVAGLTLVSGESLRIEFALFDLSGETSNRATLTLLTILKKEE